MKILVLEDSLERIEFFKKLFRNQELFVFDNSSDAYSSCIENNFQVMLLDHDLGGRIWEDSNGENTGYQFVKRIVENQLQKDALIYIHSCNPIGANLMLNLLKDNDYDGIWIPYHLIKNRE
jgi:CheY-like chemotaxis protein